MMATNTTNTTRRPGAMLAGDVAKSLGVGVQTLHYYEREGLIPPPPRSASGYRTYTPELVDRIGFVRKAQALGLPLAEIRDVLRLADGGGCPCGHVQRALADKLREVDARLRELQSFRDELARLVRRAPQLSARAAGAKVCAIVEDAPAPAAGEIAVAAPLARRRRGRR
jgi:DNA-binding transcriptional MerR regulator